MLPHIHVLGLTVPMYSLMVALGAISFIIYYKLRVERGEGIDRITSNRLIFVSILGFIVLGASALVFNSVFHSIEEGRILIGGITWLGGVIGVIPAMYWLIHKIVPRERGNALNRFSTMLPGLVFAHALGRLGCFFGGCCYGAPTNSFLGVVFPAGSLAGKEYPDTASPDFITKETEVWDTALKEFVTKTETLYPSVPVLPTQLIEAVFEIMLFAVMIVFFKKLKNYNVEIYCFAYGIFRFTLEFFRGDDRGGTGLFITPSQLMSIILWIGAVLLILFRNRKILRPLAEKCEAWRAEAAALPADAPIELPFFKNSARASADAIRELNKLREEGLITDEEFEAKKAEILERM